MPAFWMVMNGKEKLRFVFVSLVGVVLVAGYLLSLSAKEIGKVIQSAGYEAVILQVHPRGGTGIIESNPQWKLTVELHDGRHVHIKVPVRYPVKIGNKIEILERTHESGNTTFVLKG